jgi:hypothetical protein
MKPMLKPPGTKHLKLECDILHKTFAFKSNLRHCSLEQGLCNGSRGVVIRFSAPGEYIAPPEFPVDDGEGFKDQDGDDMALTSKDFDQTVNSKDAFMKRAGNAQLGLPVVRFANGVTRTVGPYTWWGGAG